MLERSLEDYKKVEQQVHDIVKAVHKEGMIRENPSPRNNIIDKNDDAWIIIFAYAADPDFVAREHMGTQFGDQTGVAKMFLWVRDRKRRWLANRCLDIPEDRDKDQDLPVKNDH